MTPETFPALHATQTSPATGTSFPAGCRCRTFRLPVNAFLLAGPEPMLVDTGVAALTLTMEIDMTHLPLTRPKDRGVVFAAAEALAIRLRLERRIRRDVARLESMSDYLLRDIGLTRSDIRAATRNGRT